MRIYASVHEKMSPPGFVVMQTYHLMADRTFCIERVTSPPPKDLQRLDEPYGENTHGCLVEFVVEPAASPALLPARMPHKTKGESAAKLRRLIKNPGSPFG